MKRKAIATLLSMLASGCAFHSEPTGNLDFYQVSQLSDFEGVYKNKGNPSGYLSALIWGGSGQIANTPITHADIEFIAVISRDDSLIVRAIDHDCARHERVYTLGRDFELSAGKIILRKETHLLTRGGDDVLLGPSHERITLGIDAAKQGKSRRKGYFAGLILMLFPVAATGTADIRYERTEASPGGFADCPSREPKDKRRGPLD